MGLDAPPNKLCRRSPARGARSAKGESITVPLPAMRSTSDVRAAKNHSSLSASSAPAFRTENSLFHCRHVRRDILGSLRKRKFAEVYEPPQVREGRISNSYSSMETACRTSSNFLFRSHAIRIVDPDRGDSSPRLRPTPQRSRRKGCSGHRLCHAGSRPDL